MEKGEFIRGLLASIFILQTVSIAIGHHDKAYVAKFHCKPDYKGSGIRVVASDVVQSQCYKVSTFLPTCNVKSLELSSDYCATLYSSSTCGSSSYEVTENTPWLNDIQEHNSEEILSVKLRRCGTFPPIDCDSGSTVRNLVICEDNTSEIRCPFGKFVHIKEASYGRKDRSTCSGPILDSNCAAGDSLRTVRNTCRWQNTCFLKASNAVFGDPCYGTKKYLEIQYTCLSAEAYKSCVDDVN